MMELKKFWDQVSYVEDQGQFIILLDGKPIILSQKHNLQVNNPQVAEALVKEWQMITSKKGDQFDFQQLPLTRITGTMIEKVAPNRAIYVDQLLPYLNSDCLCYFSENSQKLYQLQSEKWLPLVKIFENIYQVELKITTGIMPINQAQSTIETIRDNLLQLSDAKLTAMAILVPSLSSLILSFLQIEQKIPLEETYQMALLEEIFQSKTWGEDSEQTRKRMEIKTDLYEVQNFLNIFN